MKIKIFNGYFLEMVCLSVLLLMFYFMLYGHIKKWIQLKKEQILLVESLMQKKEKYTDQKKIISMLKKEESLYQWELNQLHQAVDEIVLLDQWVSLAIPFSLYWKSVQRLPSRTQGSLILESFEIRLMGDYFDLLQFVQTSLNLPFFLSFSALHFSRTTNSVQLEAKVYVYHRL